MTKPPISISLNLTYKCNFRCNFCYLTESQLGDPRRVSLEVVQERIAEIAARYEIQHVDIYGGEVLVLPETYLLAVKDILVQNSIDDISVQTNLSHLPDIVHDPDLLISVSYDFGAREKNDKVLQNMMLMQNPFCILTLASRSFLDMVSPDEYVQFMNMLNKLSSCEIKPYSSNQANCHTVSFKEYEDFVWAVITHPERNFHFENESSVRDSAQKVRNSFSDDHIYITPEGGYAVLEFDSNDNEFFLGLKDLDAYEQWCALEKKRVSENPVCSTCPHYGHCLSEHLREVITLNNSCNGFRGLIDKWIAHEKSDSLGTAPPTT